MNTKYKSIQDGINQSVSVVGAAIDDKSKSIAEFMRNLGKRCTAVWVHQQGLASQDAKRPNFYGVFLRWFAAIWLANRAGAEYLLADFELFVRQLRGLTHDGNKAFPALAAKSNRAAQVLTEIRAKLNYFEGEFLGAAA